MKKSADRNRLQHSTRWPEAGSAPGETEYRSTNDRAAGRKKLPVARQRAEGGDHQGGGEHAEASAAEHEAVGKRASAGHACGLR